MLWPDTFNNHFHPQDRASRGGGARSGRVPRHRAETSRSAAAGRCMTSACSTRPSAPARRSWTRCGRRSRPARRSSGWSRAASAVFRDEMRNLFPHGRGRPAAPRANVYLLSEFLDRRSPQSTSFPKLKRKAMVHGHCHHKSVHEDGRRGAAAAQDWGSTSSCSTRAAAAWPDRSALRRGHYDVSVKAWRARAAAGRPRGRRRHADHRRRLQLPRADRPGLPTARALHLAEVLQMAMDEGPEWSDRVASRKRGTPKNMVRPNTAVWRWPVRPEWRSAAGVIGWTIKNRRSA